MTSVRGRKCSRRERPSVTPSVALYLPSWVTNYPTSLLDPQGQNPPLLSLLLPLLMSPSIRRMTCKRFVRLFWRLELLLLLPLLLLSQFPSSPRHFRCNNVTLRGGAKSSRSGNHMTTIIQDFLLISLTSTTMPHPTGLSFRAMVPFHPTYLTTYMTPHCLRSWKVFPAMGTICVSPTCRGMGLSFLEYHWMAWSLSSRLDAIKFAPLLCRR